MSKLHEIAEQRRADVENAKAAVPIESLIAKIASRQDEPGNLFEKVQGAAGLSGATLHVAAEFKRASPSKGVMAGDEMNLEHQVRTYLEAGASVVSVLTEPKWFKGSLEDMEQAKRIVVETSSKALVLRKDFLVDTYQLFEARAYGADTVLLIVAILTDDELKGLMAESRSLGMEPLVEAANEIETKRALACGARVIGINNRDLTTFKVDLGTTTRCAKLVEHKDVLVLALSGIKSREDVTPYEAISCIRGILVGEHLMKSNNPVAEIKALVTQNGPEDSKNPTLMKICGMVRPEDALEACKAKASFIGVIFAEKSPRAVSIEQAKEIAKVVRDYRETKDAIQIQVPCLKPTPGSDSSAKRMRHTDWFQESAQALRKAASRGPLLVGVFMDHDQDFITNVVQQVGLDLVQLHGSEPWELCTQLPVPAIKVVHIPMNGDVTDDSIEDSVKAGKAAGILLDTTTKGGAEGGTGVAFDWGVAKRYQDMGIPVFVAGGLTPSNVQEAIKQANQPFGVDCSSGVQSTPREKDAGLIREFARQVEEANLL